MKVTQMIKILGLVFTLVICSCGTQNSQNIDPQDENMTMQYSEGNDFSKQMNILDSFPKGELNEKEIAGLLFMREEEKLAHDVYIVFYEKYNRRIFTNIARSEQKHTNAVLRVINRYELNDPVSTNEIGVFVNKDLQKFI